MAIPEASTTLRADGEWRAKYRDLCREFDTAQALAGDLRAQLAKLLGRFKGTAGSSGVNEAIAALRNDDGPLNMPLLRQVIDHCMRDTNAGATASAWQALATLLEHLTVPPTHVFALKFLRERGPEQCLDAQWLAQFAALLNECMAGSAPPAAHAPRESLPLAPLVDCLLIPPEFAQRAADLRETLIGGTSAAPVADVGRFLNDLYAFLRRDLRSLGEYLKAATEHLGSVEVELKAALQDSQEAATASAQLTSTLAGDVAAIDAAIEGDLSVTELKQAIESRVHSIRASMSAFVDSQRGKQSAYERRINELAARVRQFETESNTLRQKMRAEQEKAYRDTLTQLPNRLAYEERSGLEYARARRTRAPLTLAVLDLDHFKRINDEFGHRVGDKVLRHVAELCRRRMRATDLLARFGGEEFVALFPETAAAAAASVCDELRRQIEQATFQYHGLRVPVTVSIGIAELRPDEALDALFERADQALYDAKRRGRNQIVTA